MTTRSRRSSRRTSGRRREKTTWENINFEMSFTAAASSSVADLTPVFIQTNNFQTPSKIVRMIANFHLAVAGSAAATQQLSIGIWVVQHEGLTGDGAADVINDFQQDFFYWTTRHITPLTVATGVTDWSIDLRTSRRLRGGYGLLFKAQNAVQAEPLELGVSMRNLWVLS